MTALFLLASEADPTLFAGTIAQSIAAIVVFLILFAFLYRMAWGPILKGLQEREAKIKSDLESAQRAAADASATLATYQKQLASAQQESARLIEQGRADAQKVALSIKDQTQAEITALKQRATADIDAAREQALTEIYQQTAALATAVAGKILRREIHAADQQQLVNEALREMDSAKLN
jgi:F-type H+-transporting ATPase subunit b